MYQGAIRLFQNFKDSVFDTGFDDKIEDAQDHRKNDDDHNDIIVQPV